MEVNERLSERNNEELKYRNWFADCIIKPKEKIAGWYFYYTSKKQEKSENWAEWSDTSEPAAIFS